MGPGLRVCAAQAASGDYRRCDGEAQIGSHEGQWPWRLVQRFRRSARPKVRQVQISLDFTFTLCSMPRTVLNRFPPMIDQMRRLYPRDAANRGVCVDTEGATLGPDCVLVRRTATRYHEIERKEAAEVQRLILDNGLEQDWLFAQSSRIAQALNSGQIAQLDEPTTQCRTLCRPDRLSGEPGSRTLLETCPN